MSTIELQEPEIQEQTLAPPQLPEPLPALGERFFSDVLLEVGGTDRRRRRWAATTSVVFQVLGLSFLLIFPLMFTDALPRAQLVTFLIAPPPPPPPPPAAAPAPVQVVRHIDTNVMNGQLRTPGRIPQKVEMVKEDEAPPPVMGTGVVGGVPGGIPGGQLGGVIGGIVNSTSTLAVVPKLAAPKRIRVSQGVTLGLLIHKVEPDYPLLARQARIQGDVVLAAVISRDGAVENLQVVSGHPMLIPSALHAVQQWRYRPFLVSGEPVEVETKIIVTFRFAE